MVSHLAATTMVIEKVVAAMLATAVAMEERRLRASCGPALSTSGPTHCSAAQALVKRYQADGSCGGREHRSSGQEPQASAEGVADVRLLHR